MRQKYQLGDMVIVPNGGQGVISHVVGYDDYIGQYRYKVKTHTSRLTYNENSLIPHRDMLGGPKHENPPVWAKRYIPTQPEGYIGGKYDPEKGTGGRVYAGRSEGTRLDPETLEPLSQFWQAPGSNAMTVYYTPEDLERSGGWVGPASGQRGSFRKAYDDPWARYARLVDAAARKAKRDLKRRKKEGLPLYPFPKSAAPKSGGKGIGKLHSATPDELERDILDFSDTADWEKAYDDALKQDTEYRIAQSDYRALTPEEKRGRGRPKGTTDYIKRHRRTKAEIAAGVTKYSVPEHEKYAIREAEREKLTQAEAIEKFERQRPITHHHRWDNMSWEDKRAHAAELDNMTYKMFHGGKSMPGYIAPVIPLKKIPMGPSSRKPPGKAREWTDETDPWGIERGISDIPDTYVSTLTPKTKTDWWTDYEGPQPGDAPFDVQEHIIKRGRGRPPGSKNKARPIAPVIQLAAPQYRKRGRPPGSKNKPKAGAIVVAMPKRGRGRPPGSKNKPKHASNPYNDGDYMSAVRMNPGLPKHVQDAIDAANDAFIEAAEGGGRVGRNNYLRLKQHAERMLQEHLAMMRSRNPRVKGAKDTYKRVRRTAGELMASGIEDSADGMPPMSKNKHYLKGYKQAKTHPKLKGAVRPDVARAAAIKTTRVVLPMSYSEYRTLPTGTLTKKAKAKSKKRLALEAQQDFYRYNPVRHFTKAGRGKPTSAWWILDMYSARGKKISTIIGQGSKAKSTSEAKSFINKTHKGYKVTKVQLAGPYVRQPHSRTVRK